MKKLIRNAAYAAAGLLAVSCSNDIPDNVTPVNRQDTGDGMYITLNLGTGTNGTRADNANLGKEEDPENANSDESTISSIQVLLFNSNNTTDPVVNAIFGAGQAISGNVSDAEEGFKYEYNTGDSEGKAEVKIKVNQDQFNSLTNETGKLTYVILCNKTTAKTSLNDVLADNITASYTADAIAKYGEVRTGYTYQFANGEDSYSDFIMTGYGDFTPVITKDAEGKVTTTGTKDTPWKINNTNYITVEHVNSKCVVKSDDVKGDVSGEDFAFVLGGQDRNDIKVHFGAFEIFNINPSVNLFPHFYAKAAATISPVAINEKSTLTDPVSHSIAPSGYGFYAYEAGTHNYTMGNGVTTRTMYITPSTHTTKTGAKYNQVTYVSFMMTLKASELKDLELVETGNENIYSYNGVLLGCAKKMKDFKGTSKVPAQEVQAMYNSCADAEGNVDEEALMTKYGSKGLKQYKKVTTSDYYRVMYYHPITRDQFSDRSKDQHLAFGVNRNELYRIGINSIKRMGTPEDEKPDDIYNPDAVYDYIDMFVKVAPWTKRNNLYDLE